MKPYLQHLQDQLQEALPKLRINCFMNEAEDYYNLVVVITSVDPKNPLKLDPENPVNECLVSNGCLSVQDALDDLPVSLILKWMNSPLPTGAWLG